MHAITRSPPVRGRKEGIIIDAGRTFGWTVLQNFTVIPARIVRLIPYCGAPTPTPVPFRISYGGWP